MQSNLSPEKWERFKKFVGDPLRDRLREWLHAFEDPRKAVRKEVEAIKDHSFAPEGLVVHGLVYDLSSGAIEVVINGYES
jgi:carbonic anhydrase